MPRTLSRVLYHILERNLLGSADRTKGKFQIVSARLAELFLANLKGLPSRARNGQVAALFISLG